MPIFFLNLCIGFVDHGMIPAGKVKVTFALCTSLAKQDYCSSSTTFSISVSLSLRGHSQCNCNFFLDNHFSMLLLDISSRQHASKRTQAFLEDCMLAYKRGKTESFLANSFWRNNFLIFLGNIPPTQSSDC